MKQVITKGLLIAGIAMLTVPTSLLAQKEKEKEKIEKAKEKSNVQHINIVRTGDLNEKTVIEIDGDKIKINGKDIKDNKDVHVNVNTMKGMDVYRYNNGTGFNFNFNNDFGNMSSLFSEDANRGMLGINTEGDDKGAVIESVIEKSAAEKAGLRKGDIITKINDKKIESTDDVTEAIHSHKPGDKVTVTYLRDGKTQTSTAELGKWKGINMSKISIPRLQNMNGQLEDMNRQWSPEMPQVPMTFNGSFMIAGHPRLGLSIQDTDDGVGVKVLNVDEESNAAKAGIKKDDIIVGVDDQEVKGTDDVVKATRATKNKYTYNFKVNRDGKTQTIEVKIPRKLKTADL